MHAHTTHKEILGGASTRCRELGASKEHWCGPAVSHCWAMIDIHTARLVFYHKATKVAFIPLKAKAVLTLGSLRNTEELVAELARWQQLNAAWGGTGSVGVFVAQNLVKATSGCGAKEHGDGSRVCLLYKQDQILPPHRDRDGSYDGGERAPSRAVTPRVCQGTWGVTYCPKIT